jgi:hypothetical protein
VVFHTDIYCTLIRLTLSIVLSFHPLPPPIFPQLYIEFCMPSPDFSTAFVGFLMPSSYTDAVYFDIVYLHLSLLLPFISPSSPTIIIMCVCVCVCVCVCDLCPSELDLLNMTIYNNSFFFMAE